MLVLRAQVRIQQGGFAHQLQTLRKLFPLTVQYVTFAQL